MIECSFCLTSKSQRYIYAACEHFICLNCAALRAGQTLQCCNKLTSLQSQVKKQLKMKKELIINNLQKGYEYEKTDLNKISFNQIEERLRKINKLQSKNINNKQDNLQYQLNNEIDMQMNSTPINQFYKNPNILDEQKYNLIQTTPIKLVSNTDQEDQYQEQIHKTINNDDYACIYQKQSMYNNYQPSKKVQSKMLKQQFLPILQNQIHSVREKFKTFYDQLQKKEATLIYQMKIYFQEYVKLIQKQKFNNLQDQSSMQKNRVDTFLNEFVQNWRLKDIENVLSYQIKNTQENYNYEQKHQLIQQNRLQNRYICDQKVRPLQGCRLNYQKNGIKNDKKDEYVDRIRLSEQHQAQNVQINNHLISSTNRNMDKIYRKLEQSRSKLQQRIQIHNQFMNKRCLKVNYY